MKMKLLLLITNNSNVIVNISDNEFLIFATFETPALNVILENEFETSLCFIPYGGEYKEAAKMKESTAFTEA